MNENKKEKYSLEEDKLFERQNSKRNKNQTCCTCSSDKKRWKRKESSKIRTSPITRSPYIFFSFLSRIVIRELVRTIKLSRALIRGYAGT